MTHERHATRGGMVTGLALACLALVGTASAQQPKPTPQPLSILPPPKPAETKPGETKPGAPAAQRKPATPLDRAATIAKVNAYLNGMTALTGDFQQIGADGRKLAGKIYLLKPGRLRFEYDAPATLEVVSDGKSVAVRDRRLNTQDLYNIGQTPLKFLVRDQIDIGKETSVVDVKAGDDGVTVTLEDKATLTGTSRIRLVFDPEIQVLREWTVRDPQGSETQVRLANLDAGKRPNPKLFAINYERLLEDKR